MLAGRNLGWWLSKAVLYQSPLPLTLVFCLGWGALIGFALHGLFREFNLGTIAKIFAYGAGAYVSIPNFRLFASIPSVAQGRHLLIQYVPFAAFVGLSLVCGWLSVRIGLVRRPPKCRCTRLSIALEVGPVQWHTLARGY